ncbi:hypothetical protein TrST_g6314 [Triparma strigata]|uniref:O-fucosyltransferase family protein n=1 Tax=Triparma strigata TaxID=1606541 RepID=A0A9W7C4P9_9STRA|nr:hypothetical protein TrST_g6314 [Triparma strigata]
MKIRVKHVVFLMCLQMALLLIWRSSTETSGMGQGGVLGRGMMNGLSSGRGTSYVGRWNVGGSKGATPNVHSSSKGVTWFTSSEGFARQLQTFSCMVNFAEHSGRNLELLRFTSKHYKREVGSTKRDMALPHMDEIIDLNRIYNGDPKQPHVTRMDWPNLKPKQEDSMKCDKSIGVKIKWEDDDYDWRPVEAKRMGLKARCPKSDIHCRAEFDKPKYVKIQNTLSPEQLFEDDFRMSKLCVSSLPLESCKNYLPFIATERYEAMYKDFVKEMLDAMSGEFITVHLRRGDRCGEEYRTDRKILYKSGACGPLQTWITKLKNQLSFSFFTSMKIYVATDDISEETTKALRDAGFYVLRDLTDNFPDGIEHGEITLKELDLFLIDMHMMVHAKRSFVVEAWTTVTEIVDTTRAHLHLSPVEMI